MFERRQQRGRFRRRPNGRKPMSHSGGNPQSRIRPNGFSNGQLRNSFRNSLSSEKLLEKYNLLAKEAMTSGDRTLAENYLQHADHYMRIIEDKNKNRNQNKTNDTDKPIVEEKKLIDGADIKQSLEIKNK